MRWTLLAAFLCAGTTALCQSAVPAPGSSGMPEAKPSVNPPWTDLNKFVPPGRLTTITPDNPNSNAGAAWSGYGAASKAGTISPLFPQWNTGVPSSSMLIAQNDLRHLDLGLGQHLGRRVSPQPDVRMEPIPTMWPEAKAEPIPTQLSNLSLLPIATPHGVPAILKARGR